jgi:UDP-glucose 4-epimerase
MEQALRYELESRITELADEVYPTNAPETATKPYLVYARINTDRTKLLTGYTQDQALSFMFSIMATRYGDMKSLTRKVEDFLLSTPGTTIGEENILVEDIKINNIHEVYEHELKVNRGIIDFTIYI